MKLVTKSTLCALVLAVGASIATAQIAIETDGSNAANLTKITVDGTEYTSFIGVDMTDFNMYNASNTKAYQIVAAGTGPFYGTAASGLMEDLSLTTGYSGMYNLSFDFDTPVVNRTGADIFLFEIIGTETSNVLNVTLNGMTINEAVGGNPFVASGTIVDATSRTGKPSGTGFPPYTVALLEAVSAWESPASIVDADIVYLALDLSDYGVANGGSVSNIVLAGDGQYDITGVVGLANIPESSTYAMIFGACAAGLVLIRRKRKQG